MMRCSCEDPVVIPCVTHPQARYLPNGRSWLICYACATWWGETNQAYVDSVWQDAEDDATMAALGRILCRHHHHRWINGLFAGQVCRDCGDIS